MKKSKSLDDLSIKIIDRTVMDDTPLTQYEIELYIAQIDKEISNNPSKEDISTAIGILHNLTAHAIRGKNTNPLGLLSKKFEEVIKKYYSNPVSDEDKMHQSKGLSLIEKAKQMLSKADIEQKQNTNSNATSELRFASASGTLNPSHNHGATAAAAAPRPPIHHDDNNALREKENEQENLKYGSILGDIVISVLNSLIDRVISTPEGCNLVIKPEVSKKIFKPYMFHSGYYWGMNKARVDIFDAVDQIVIKNELSKTGDMTAMEYVCKFLELAGLKPQIGSYNNIIVKDKILMDFYKTSFDLTELKDNDQLDLYYNFGGINRIARKKMLKNTSSDVAYWIIKQWPDQDFLDYTPAKSSDFWEKYDLGLQYKVQIVRD